MNSGIYTISHATSGKLYVGSAVDFRKRWNQHKHLLRRGEHHSLHLQSAWNKYGEESFKFKKLLYCAKEMLVFYEQRAIDSLSSFNREFGYNARENASSQLGMKHSEVTKEKLRKANIGKKYSADTCAKLSAMRLGKKMPAGFGAKARAWKLGVPHTDEAKRKMSVAKSGVPHTEKAVEARSKLTYDKADEIRRIYIEGKRTQASIAKEFCVDPSIISDVVRNKKWIRKDTKC